MTMHAAILLVMVIQLLAWVWYAVRDKENLISAIHRQDDRIRKRLERGEAAVDQDMIGQIVDELRTRAEDVEVGYLDSETFAGRVRKLEEFH